jgi:hypothetical protein
MGATKNFDPKRWAIIVAGVPVVGLASDSMITVKRSEDSYTKYVGVLGEVTRSRQHNKTGEFTFKLMQSSPLNDVFSGLLLLDNMSNAGVVPIVLKDFNSTTILTCGEAWIRKNPDYELGKDMKEIEWTFDAADLDEFFGGSIT